MRVEISNSLSMIGDNYLRGLMLAKLDLTLLVFTVYVSPLFVYDINTNASYVH